MILNWVFIIGITLITVIVATLLARRANKREGGDGHITNKDFLLGGGNLGAFVAAGTLCATYWSGHAFVGSVGTSYAFGYTQLISAASYVVALVLAVLFLAKFLKKKADKLGSLSIPQYTGQTHGSLVVHGLAAVGNILFMFVLMITQFKAFGHLLSPLLGVNGNVIAVILGTICIAYTMYGGLKSVAYSDLIMAIGMAIGAVLCVIIVFSNMSLSEMTANLTAIDPELTRPTTGEPYGEPQWGAFLIIPYALMGLIATPYTATRFLSVKSDIKWWKFGLWCGIIAMLWELLPFVGFFVRAENVQLTSADQAMGYFLENYTNIIMTAFIAVCIMAAIRSTVDSILQSIASTISYDLRYVINKGKGMDDTKKAMRYNRIAVLCVGAVGIIVNFFTEPEFLVFMGTLGSAPLETMLFGTMFISTFWVGNKYGAIASMIGGTIATTYFLVSETFMWTTAPIVGNIIAAVLYVGVSLATFKIAPRVDINNVAPAAEPPVAVT